MKLFHDDTLKSWAYYDYANSSYVLIFQAFLLPIFFSKYLNLGFVLESWGLANGISTVVGLIFAVVAGSYSDKNERLKSFRFLILLTFVGITVMSLAIQFYPIVVFYCYIITNAFFIATISLSDSLLTFISEKKNSNTYSGMAWGWGYLGGIVSLIIVMVLQYFTFEFSTISFLSVGLFYLIYSIRALKGLRSNKEIFSNNLENQTVYKEIKPIVTRKDRFYLLLGYWLISECITVVILFFSIYASSELKLTTSTIGIILLFVQVIGIFTTWHGGKLADKFNNIVLLGISIFLWAIIILLLVYVRNSIGLILITILTGCVIGNSQSYLRAQFSQITRKYEAGIQFGAFSISNQAAVLFGPIMFGLLSKHLGSQKVPLLINGVCMIIGYFVVKRRITVINTKMPS